MAERGIRRYDVRGFPDREVVFFYVPYSRRYCRENSAVEYEPAFPDRKDVEGISREIGKIDDNMEDARPDDRREEQVHAHVHDTVGV